MIKNHSCHHGGGEEKWRKIKSSQKSCLTQTHSAALKILRENRVLPHEKRSKDVGWSMKLALHLTLPLALGRHLISISASEARKHVALFTEGHVSWAFPANSLLHGPMWKGHVETTV